MAPSLHKSRWLSLPGLIAALLGVFLCLGPAPALAIAASGLPDTPPQERILDTADVLSRAAIAELSKTLESFSTDRVDAHLITVNRLDYGLSLPQLGAQVLERWSAAGGNPLQLLFLIDSQTNSAAVVASPDLSGQLDPSLLRSTARTTMGQPLREGGRYRQASLAAIERLQTVLAGGEDPGPPVQAHATTVAPVRVPSHEQTLSSNAFTWVVVLLVVGTVVPMLTWWVFSR